MNINWEKHGHPGNYIVRRGTLIKAVNDYLDELNFSRDAYHGFASHLTMLGLIGRGDKGYQFTGSLTQARKRDLYHLPSALGSLAASNWEQYRPNQRVYVLNNFQQTEQEVITTLDPTKLLEMRRLLEDIR